MYCLWIDRLFACSHEAVVNVSIWWMAQQCCWPHSTVQRNASWNHCSVYGWFGFPWLDNEHGAKTAAVSYPPLRYLLGQRADITHTGVISVSTDKDAHAVCSLVSFTYSRAISVSTSRGSGVLTRPLQHPNWGQVCVNRHKALAGIPIAMLCCHGRRIQRTQNSAFFPCTLWAPWCSKINGCLFGSRYWPGM